MCSASTTCCARQTAARCGPTWSCSIGGCTRASPPARPNPSPPAQLFPVSQCGTCACYSSLPQLLGALKHAVDFPMRATCAWNALKKTPIALLFCVRLAAGSTPIVPGQHGDPRLYAANLENITQKLLTWARAPDGSAPVRLLFAVTSPMLNDKTIDDVVVGLVARLANGGLGGMRQTVSRDTKTRGVGMGCGFCAT